MKLLPYTDNLKPGWNKGFITTMTYYALLFLTFGAGVYFRLLSLASTPLWYDEAERAILMCNPMALFRENVAFNGSCSVGYILTNSLIGSIYNTDFTLRLTSLIPSIISIILIYRIAVQLTNRKIIHLLAVFFVSLNIFLIGYAKELKPYSFELMIHLLNVSLLLSYLKEKSFRNLAILLGCAYFSLYFATNIIFLYPAIFLIVSVDAIHDKDRRRMKYIAMTAGLCLITFGLLYIALFYKATSISAFTDATKSLYYLKGEAALPFSLVGFLHWVGQRTAEMIVNFSSPRVNFIYAGFFERSNMIIMPALYLFGLLTILIKREYKYLVVFILPVLTVIFFTLPLPVKWPYGWARMNIFLCGYFLFVVMLALNYLLNVRILKYLACFYIIILFAIHLPLNLDPYRWMTNEDIISSLGYLQANAKTANADQDLLCVNLGGHKAFQYYTKYNTVTSKKFKNTIDNLEILIVPNAYNKYNEMDVNMREAFRRRKHVWYLYSHLAVTEADLVEKILRKYSVILKKQQYSFSGVYYCESKILPVPY